MAKPDARQAVAAALAASGPLTTPDLQRAAGLTRGSTRRALAALELTGIVHRTRPAATDKPGRPARTWALSGVSAGISAGFSAGFSAAHRPAGNASGAPLSGFAAAYAAGFSAGFSAALQPSIPVDVNTRDNSRRYAPGVITGGAFARAGEADRKGTPFLAGPAEPAALAAPGPKLAPGVRPGRRPGSLLLLPTRMAPKATRNAPKARGASTATLAPVNAVAAAEATTAALDANRAGSPADVTLTPAVVPLTPAAVGLAASDSAPAGGAAPPRRRPGRPRMSDQERAERDAARAAERAHKAAAREAARAEREAERAAAKAAKAAEREARRQADWRLTWEALRAAIHETTGNRDPRAHSAIGGRLRELGVTDDEDAARIWRAFVADRRRANPARWYQFMGPWVHWPNALGLFLVQNPAALEREDDMSDEERAWRAANV